MAADRFYKSPEWKRIRLAVLARDGRVCQLQLPNCKTHATHVDHIVPVSDGGDRLELSNLRAACGSCNISARNTRLAQVAREARDGKPYSAPSGQVADHYPTTPAERFAAYGYDW